VLCGVSLACSDGMNSLDLHAQLKVAGQGGLRRLPCQHTCRQTSTQDVTLHDIMCLGRSCHGPNAVDGEANVSCLTRRLSASPAEQLLDNDTSSDVVSSPATSIFVMRDNPRQFFVRQPLPSTASAQTSSPAPSKEPEEAPAESKARSGTATLAAGQCIVPLISAAHIAYCSVLESMLS